VRRFIISHRAMLSAQGSVTTTWRWRRCRRLGPYYRLAYRDGFGRQRSIYLGTDAGLAAEVQDALARLRAFDEERRQIDRVRRAVRRQLRQLRAALNEELRPLSLRFQGSEIRGWSANRDLA
jgi:hypothetical protein